MKARICFDTLAFANRLKAAGIDAKYAEAAAEANAAMVASLLDNGLSTRQDLVELENRLILRIGGIVLGGLTLFTGIIHFIH